MYKNVEVKLDIFFVKEDNFYIAFSPAMDLTAYGNSMRDAKKSFETTFQIYLEESFKDDTLIDDLLKHGWTVQTQPTAKFTPPKTDKKALYQIYNVVKEQRQSFSLVA